jgi:hypothetical protein
VSGGVSLSSEIQGKCDVCGVPVEYMADVCERHALNTQDYLRFHELMQEAWRIVYQEKEAREA